MSRCSIKEATHGVLGEHQGARGILFWHDNEFAAHAEARQIRAAGGTAKVVPYSEQTCREATTFVFMGSMKFDPDFE